MTIEQKIELLDYIANEIKKLDEQSTEIKKDFDSSVSFTQMVDCIAKIKYIEGQLTALTKLMQDFNLRSTSFEQNICLN
jgi:hypothetical protein